MTERPRIRPAGPLLLLAVLAGLVLATVGLAGPAHAHAYLVASSPANGAVVQTAPREVVLTFSEPVRPVADRIQVIGPGGERVDAGQPRADGPDVLIPLAEDVAARGTYLVSYRVISADSHPIGGSITYSIGAPSQTPALAGTDDLEDPGLRTAVSVNRYVGYAGLVLVVGPALILTLLWPQRLSRRGPGRLLWVGMGLIGASTLAGLVLQAPYTTGSSLGEVRLADVADVLGSTFGQAHLVRLGVLAAAAVLLRPVVAGRADRGDLLLLAALAVIGLGTWPASGHPVASPVPAISLVVTTVHLAAAAFWVGGLIMLAGFLLRLANERELGAILPAWSGWAASAVAALLVAGVIQSVIEVGTPGALVTTTYGRLLLVKVGLVALVIAVAAYSRHLVRRRLAATRPRAMRLAVAVEAVVLAAVVAMSAVLVQTTPARTEAAADARSVITADFSTTLDTELYSLQVTVEPVRVGSNTVHLYAFTPTGQPLPVAEWAASAALPAEGVEPIGISLLRITDNHALGEVALPVAGEWEFRFTLRISEIDQMSVSVTVPVGT